MTATHVTSNWRGLLPKWHQIDDHRTNHLSNCRQIWNGLARVGVRHIQQSRKYFVYNFHNFVCVTTFLHPCLRVCICSSKKLTDFIFKPNDPLCQMIAEHWGNKVSCKWDSIKGRCKPCILWLICHRRKIINQTMIYKNAMSIAVHWWSPFYLQNFELISFAWTAQFLIVACANYLKSDRQTALWWMSEWVA